MGRGPPFRVTEVEDDYGTTSVRVQLTNQSKPAEDTTAISVEPNAVSGTNTRAEAPRPTPLNTGRALRWPVGFFSGDCL